jgi:LysW-gamma-L-lysine carboxypeptidase
MNKSLHQFDNETNNELSTLVGLLNIYSPTGQEEEAVNYLVKRMRNLGFTRAFKDAVGNAVGIIGKGPKQIVLLGHIDTIPGNIPLRVTGSQVYGRGAVDAKGALSAFTEAAAWIGEVSGWQMIVIGAVDEEGESIGSRSIVNAYHPEFAIVGEPNFWNRIAIGYKGSARAKLSLQLPKFHSARLEKTVFSILMETWNKIEAWVESYNSKQERIFNQVQVIINDWSSRDDGFNHYAELMLAARLPPGITAEEWYKVLYDLSPGLELAPIGYPINAFQSVKNSPLVKAFLNSIRLENGKPEFVFKSGTADYNIIGPAWNCPAIVYGPGDSQFDHTPDEHIEISDYLHAVKVLIHSLKLLTSSQWINSDKTGRAETNL